MPPFRVSCKVAAAIVSHGNGASPAVRAPLLDLLEPWSQERESAVSEALL